MAPKLKVLCLHGYMQNATLFHSRMGSWRKALKASVEFVCLDGPHAAQHSSPESAETERSWWTWEDEGGLRPSKVADYTGWEATEAAIEAALKEHSPVHGIVGFSQGACCAARYSVRAALNDKLPAPQFVVFISGFLPRDETWATEMHEAGLQVPTFHVLGEDDGIITPQQSEALIAVCNADMALELRHPGGHYIPTCTGDVRGTVRGFFSERYDEILAPVEV